MIGAAHHGHEFELRVAARSPKGLDHQRARLSRGVGIDDVQAHLHLPVFGGVGARIIDRLNDGVATSEIGVSHVNLERRAAGNAVDRSGKDVADAGGGHRIERAGGTGGGLGSERYFGGSQEGVVAIGHQHSTGMPAPTLN